MHVWGVPVQPKHSETWFVIIPAFFNFSLHGLLKKYGPKLNGSRLGMNIPQMRCQKWIHEF
jgi:hypothetical protein